MTQNLLVKQKQLKFSDWFVAPCHRLLGLFHYVNLSVPYVHVFGGQWGIIQTTV